MRAAIPTPDRKLEAGWGRFTALGGPSVERAATALSRRIAKCVSDVVPAPRIRSVLLIGGYGRGEGGVVHRSGAEGLHNNLDVLLILRGRGSRLAASDLAELREAFDRLEMQFDVGIDFSTQTDAYLRRAPGLVMWYDMRFGHKTLLGDPDFVPNLTRFQVDRILPSDVRDLLVNRSTLLLLNDFILEQASGTEAQRRALVRHAAKAIIGVGDAMLFFRGRYHWSYREKCRRLSVLDGISDSFRQLYRQAAHFRLAPSYEAFRISDPARWMADLKSALEPVHLQCESLRLGIPGLRWGDYGSATKRRELSESLRTVRRSAGMVRNVVRPSRSPAHLTPEGSPQVGRLEALTSRMIGARALLPIALPAALYPEANDALGEHAAAIVGSPSTAPSDLRRAFLRSWRISADPNLDLALGRMGVSPQALDEKPQSGTGEVTRGRGPHLSVLWAEGDLA